MKTLAKYFMLVVKP